MENLETNNTGNLALVNPLQAEGTVAPTPPERLGSRVLELASILQTTLDIDQQVLLFGREMQRYIEVDGLEYTLPNGERTYLYGRNAAERATYALVLHDVSLGSIRACRDLPFTESELNSLENLLCALIYPLRNALTYKQAVELASRDTLTGVQNRLAMNTALPRESRILMAPLSADAGGWGQIAQGGWASADDPGYRKMLELVEASIAPLEARDLCGTCNREPCECKSCWVRDARRAYKERLQASKGNP